MKRFICLAFTVLFSIATLRKLAGLNPMPLTSFLSALSTVDIRFDDLIFKVTELGNALVFPTFGSSGNIFAEFALFFEWLYKLLVAIVEVPLALVKDAIDFLDSIFKFFVLLIS